MKEKLYIQEFICNLVLLNTLSYKILHGFPVRL